jgi:hypothetical protein
MASPQFLTPKPLSSPSPVKRFTLAKANLTLPLVKRIVSDIVKTHAQVVALQAAVETAKLKDQPAVQADLDRALEQLQTYVDELHDIGCDLKDYQIGLVDFLGRHQGRPVCLCWKLGEETIGYWHELRAGFAGRQPITSLQEE